MKIMSRLNLAAAFPTLFLIAMGAAILWVTQLSTAGIILALLATVGAVVTFILASAAKSALRPVNALVAGARKLAKGDTDIHLDTAGSGDFTALSAALNDTAAAIQRIREDVQTLREACANGTLSARVEPLEHSPGFAELAQTLNGMMESMETPLTEVLAVQKNICVNDLTVKVSSGYPGIFGDLAGSANGIIAQVMGVTKAFTAVSEGDFTMLAGYEKIGRRSQNDELIPAGIRMMHAVTALVEETNILTEAISAGRLDVRGDESKFEGRYREVIRGMNHIMETTEVPLNEAMAVLGEMSRNNLSQAMAGSYEGLFDSLSKAINSMRQNLCETLEGVSASAEQVASGTQQVSSGAQALSQGATEQASAIEQLTASLEEIAGQTKQNAVNANEASNLAVAAKDEAVEGNNRMLGLQHAMKEINEASANISKIIKVIDDIAFQTNLLALNAAVEAARAGQHGKGFAVVAEEVRNLAQRSANAARETTDMIEESIKRVKAGTALADETAQSLTRIVTGVEKATELVGGIARASSEQATAVAQINGGIGQVSQVTQTNSATAEESAAASEELSSQAVLLKEMVGRFNLKGSAGSPTTATLPAVKAPPRGKPAQGKPKIALNDAEFGKY